jgi:signal transduction histidine kinase/ligand-binding sensor domain-containing protein/CheY-like chemotaxis protein
VIPGGRAFAAAVAAIPLLLAGAPAAAIDPAKSLSQFAHDVWQIEHGLPQNTVYAIAQTPDGYLWLGTAEGLVRFDGVRFSVFDRRNTPAISSNIVSVLLVDRKGALWIGTDGGLLHMKDGELAAAPGPRGRVTALMEDAAGVMWVGTFERGAARLVGGQVQPLTTREGLNSDRVRALAQTPDGTVWIATEGGGLNQVKGGSVLAWGRRQGLLSDRVRTLLVDRKGGLWAGTYEDGVNVLRDGRVETITTKDGLPSGNVATLYEDRQGNVWVGTAGRGLARMREGHVDVLDARLGLSDDYVRSLAEDREGSLWIGTNVGGLNRLRDGNFTPHAAREGLLADDVRAVAQDRAGAVWVGTQGGGLGELRDGKVVRTLSTADGLLDDRIYTIVEDPEGALWIGGRGRGVNRLQDGRLTAYRPPEGQMSSGVHTILRDRRGSLWLGTFRDGLYRLDVTRAGATVEGTLVHLTTRDGLRSDAILALAEDRGGDLWVGTSGGGLQRLRDGKVAATLTTREGLPSDFVFAIHEDAGGALWIGTYGGGLARLEGGRLFTFGTAQGLFDDVIYSIVEDGFGDLWFTCNRGIFRAKRSDLEKVAQGSLAAVSSRVFGLPDGMRSVECNSGGQPALRTRDGRLWFATVKGAVVVDPARLRRNESIPPVHIESVRLDDQAVEGAALRRSEPLAVPPGGRNVEFHYTALSLRAPTRVRFRYRLEGLDRDWTEAETRRVAYYNRIPHGRYAFRVVACNDDGVWNEVGATLALSVAPHFYETPWFRGVFVAAILLGGLAAHRLRVRQLKRRQDELVQLVDERTAALRLSEEGAQQAREDAVRANQAKSAFLAHMSHELRTPLNAILGFAQLMRHQGGRTAEDREYLALIGSSGQHLLRLINDVLSLSKIEAGRLTLDEHPFDPGALLGSLNEMFRLAAREKGLALRVDVEGTLPRGVRGDEGKLRQVLVNLLANAIKFTREGRVVLRASWSEGHAVFEVEDTGPGIAEEERGRLFQAFSQTDTGRKSAEGTGLGLAISQNFVRVMGGSLSLKTATGGGTCFRVELPLPATEGPAAEVAEPAAGLRLAPGQPPPRLLVVDDMPENRLLLGRILAGMGFEVREAADGPSALAAWEGWRPHLVWMDVRLGTIDGCEAAGEIRRREARKGWPRTPVIALTAGVFDDHERVLASGCDEIVAKPFQVRTIAQVLSRYLGVRFAEPALGEASPAQPTASSALDLHHVSQEWRLALHSAVTLGDVQAAYRVVERIRENDEVLADALRGMIRSYRFDEILSLTESA